MRTVRTRSRLGVAAACTAGLAASLASVARAEEPARWRGEGTLDLGAGLAVRDNRGAVGQTEGTAVALGYAFDLAWLGARGPHVVSLSLHDAEGMSFTPVDGVAVKMIDDLALRAGYELALSRFIGPFLEVEGRAPLFATEEVRSSPSTFVLLREDGSSVRFVEKKLALTGPLRPLSLRESIGARVSPFTSVPFAIRVDAGFGAGQIVASGGRALVDDGETTSVEVVETQSSFAVGPELALGARGRVDGRRLVYALEARARLPLASSRVRVAHDLGAAERIEVGLAARVSIELVPWLTLDYGIDLARRPLLTDRLEVVDTLVLAARPTGEGLVF